MKLLSIAAFALFMISCSGWGHVMTRWSSWRERNDFAFMAVVGIAGLTLVGGVLNLVRLARPLELNILVLAGLVIFVADYAARIKNWRAASPAGSSKAPFDAMGWLPLAMLAAASAFYALTLLPADVFNISDDFYTYVLRPVRMLQTGTLAGNPYEMLGLDSLGANAFLQGFILPLFSIQYLLGFDAVFGFALSGLLLLALARKFDLHWIHAAFAMLAFIVINPQAVNISALYISSALILGIVLASCVLLEQLDPAHHASQKITAIALGLLFAALIALKVTYVAYALAYFAIFFAAVWWRTPDRKLVLRLCGLTVLSTLASLLPWLALFADNYLAALQLMLHPAVTGAAAAGGFSMPKGNVAALFSSGDLFYGGSFLSYGLMVLFLLVVACYAIFILVGNGVESARHRYLPIAAAACMAGVISYLFNGLLFNPDLAVRYSCPVLLASFPFAVLATAMALPDPARPAGLKAILVLAMPALLAVLFWNNFITRLERAYTLHETISFDMNEPYLAYNRYAVSDAARLALRAIQSGTEPGAKIFAWVAMPMHLDFSRNGIYTLREPALLNPWLDMPYTGNALDTAHYLKGQGVRYILWETSGYGMPTDDKVRRMLTFPNLMYRKIAQRSLYLRKVLAVMMQGGTFLYYSDNFVLFDLQQLRD